MDSLKQWLAYSLKEAIAKLAENDRYLNGESYSVEYQQNDNLSCLLRVKPANSNSGGRYFEFRVKEVL